VTSLQLAVAGLHQVSSGGEVGEVFVEDAEGTGADGAGCGVLGRHAGGWCRWHRGCAGGGQQR
jgi:hypothetical protein